MAAKLGSRKFIIAAGALVSNVLLAVLIIMKCGETNAAAWGFLGTFTISAFSLFGVYFGVQGLGIDRITEKTKAAMATKVAGTEASVTGGAATAEQ